MPEPAASVTPPPELISTVPVVVMDWPVPVPIASVPPVCSVTLAAPALMPVAAVTVLIVRPLESW